MGILKMVLFRGGEVRDLQVVDDSYVITYEPYNGEKTDIKININGTIEYLKSSDGNWYDSSLFKFKCPFESPVNIYDVEYANLRVDRARTTTGAFHRTFTSVEASMECNEANSNFVSTQMMLLDPINFSYIKFDCIFLDKDGIKFCTKGCFVSSTVFSDDLFGVNMKFNLSVDVAKWGELFG